MAVTPYKIASLPKQILILTMKNLLLFKRNYVGTSLELLCPFIFISFLLVIRYFIEKIKFYNQFAPSSYSNSVLDLYTNMSMQDRVVVLFYPNNNFIRGLVENAMNFLSLNNPEFVPTSKSPTF